MIQLLINILIFIIGFIDRFEKDDEKIVRSFDLDGIKVKTDTGWQQASQIHMTRPFSIYTVSTKDYELSGADTHICYDELFNEKFLRDFRVGDYIMTIDGPQLINKVTRNTTKVCMCDMSVESEDHRYYTNGILSHNTTSSAMFLLWYILFNTHKNAIVLGNKGKTAKEILSKVKQVFLEVPYFLKPGVEKWNENEVVFDNGCRILTETTVAEPAIGFTLHCVLLDEFAHIAPNIQETFYSNIFPTIDAANAKLMITSTQNGPELFCRLFVAAENGDNDFAPFTTNWDEVPNWNPETKSWEKRDEEWRRRKVANLGSEEAFNEQYGCDFAVATNALIPQRYLTKKQMNVKHFVNKDLPGVSYADCFYWHPDYDPMDMRNDYIVFTTDIATGVQEDYTNVQFNKLIGIGDDRQPIFRTVGYFRTNILDDKECCRTLAEFINIYCHHNRYLYSFESNLYGELWKSNFRQLADTEFTKNFTMDNFIKFYNETLTRYHYGVQITYKSKQLGCKLFRTAYTKNYIINDSHIFYNELKCFCDKNGNGTYAAIYGHDDTVMSQIQLPLIYDTIQFKDFLEEFISHSGVEDKGQNENFFQDIQPEPGQGLPVGGMGLDNFMPSSFRMIHPQNDGSLYDAGMVEGVPVLPGDNPGGNEGGTLYDF